MSTNVVPTLKDFENKYKNYKYLISCGNSEKTIRKTTGGDYEGHYAEGNKPRWEGSTDNSDPVYCFNHNISLSLNGEINIPELTKLTCYTVIDDGVAYVKNAQLFIMSPTGAKVRIKIRDEYNPAQLAYLEYSNNAITCYFYKACNKIRSNQRDKYYDNYNEEYVITYYDEYEVIYESYQFSIGPSIKEKLYPKSAPVQAVNSNKPEIAKANNASKKLSTSQLMSLTLSVSRLIDEKYPNLVDSTTSDKILEDLFGIFNKYLS